MQDRVGGLELEGGRRMEDEPRPSGQRRRKTTYGNLRDGSTETQQVVERRASV